MDSQIEQLEPKAEQLAMQMRHLRGQITSGMQDHLAAYAEQFIGAQVELNATLASSKADTALVTMKHEMRRMLGVLKSRVSEVLFLDELWINLDTGKGPQGWGSVAMTSMAVVDLPQSMVDALAPVMSEMNGLLPRHGFPTVGIPRNWREIRNEPLLSLFRSYSTVGGELSTLRERIARLRGDIAAKEQRARWDSL